MTTQTMKKIRVALDGGPEMTAYSNGETWNGFACPRFTKEELLSHLESECFYSEGVQMVRYDADRDAFIVRTGYDDAPEEVVDGQDFETIDGTLRLYALGAWGWCWHGGDEVEDEPATFRAGINRHGETPGFDSDEFTSFADARKALAMRADALGWAELTASIDAAVEGDSCVWPVNRKGLKVDESKAFEVFYIERY